jgi:hypothetical protein
MVHLKKRSKRCVCKYCGSKLSLRRIIFNDLVEARLEIMCDDCDRIEYGVEPEIYANAKYYVDEIGFNAYPDMDFNERTKQRTIAKVCEIMTWENKNLGLIDDNGFCVPYSVNRNILGECIILGDQDLKDDDDDMDISLYEPVDMVEILNT